MQVRIICFWSVNDSLTVGTRRKRLAWVVLLVLVCANVARTLSSVLMYV